MQTILTNVAVNILPYDKIIQLKSLQNSVRVICHKKELQEL